MSDIERIQRSFLHIVLENMYIDYSKALEKLDLETLENRRTQICKNFALKASKHPKHQAWFKVNDPVGTRSEKPGFRVPLGRLQRYINSPIPYLTSLLTNQWEICILQLRLCITSHFQWIIVSESMCTYTLPGFVCKHNLCYLSHLDNKPFIIIIIIITCSEHNSV